MLAIDIRDSDVGVIAAHQPITADRVRLYLEDAGLRVREIAPTQSDPRVYHLALNGDPELAVAILQRIGGAGRRSEMGYPEST